MPFASDTRRQLALFGMALLAVLLQAAGLEMIGEREALLGPAIADAFNVERIASVSLGRTWKGLSEAERTEFTELLAALIVATYADRFDQYTGQRFVTDRVEAVRTGFVVYTTLERPGNSSVSLNYFLGIFNVVADGVSDLSLRRADYNSIVKKEGYASLLAHLRNKIKQARDRQ
ncbi:MAG: hypothetical protein EBU28_05940 [Gammaproteobacteria bacterium]|nr:hypothetical protein [Gammaproteobacteria bacterium]